ACNIEAHPKPNYIDIVKVLLPTPLKPGDSVTITTPFTVTLPTYFSRSGYADEQFMICQWYPKPAVFDKDGWHEMPYLDMGEFYSEYGNFVVNITVPSENVVAATGVLQTKNELESYINIGKHNVANRNEKPLLYKPINGSDNTKTIQYKAENVLDFAWFTDKNLVIQYDTIQLPSGRVIDAFSYYHNNKNSLWKNSIDYIKDATKAYSSYLGDYEYPVVQAIEGPKNNSSGGMEYPMITLITSPDAKIETLDGVIAHEVGHNWLMGFLGSNERVNGWMDEGINTYFQFRYEAAKYRYNSAIGPKLPSYIKQLEEPIFLSTIYKVLLSVPTPYPIQTSSEVFKTSEEYGITIYLKTAIWLYIVEVTLGKDILDKAFKDYFNEWKFKHPQPADLKRSFEKSTGKNLDTLFALLEKQGSLE
ncbi:MAG: M1 family metallopeptidase, partial [Chitinophagaceae bacterium]